MSKERQGEIALSLVKTLQEKYGHLIKISVLLDLISSEPGVTAKEAGVFLGMVAILPKEVPSEGMTGTSKT